MHTATKSPWLERRLRGITGTDVAAILGIHKYRSALDVWGEKTGRLPAPDLGDSEAVYWGSRLESIVLDEYIRRTGRPLLAPEEWASEGVHMLALDHEGETKYMLGRNAAGEEHLLCTPDGMANRWKPLPWADEQEALEGRGMVEAKTGSAYVGHDWAEGAPLIYQVQAAYNAAVAKNSWFSLTGLLGGQRHLTYDYALKPELAELLLSTATDFWRNHVLADVEPDVANVVSLPAWAKMHPIDDSTTIELDAEAWEAKDRHLQSLKADAKALTKEIKDIEATLKGAIGDSTIALIPGVAQYSLKTQSRAEKLVAASTFRVLRRKAL